jgi:hypothetical protein
MYVDQKHRRSDKSLKPFLSAFLNISFLLHYSIQFIPNAARRIRKNCFLFFQRRKRDIYQLASFYILRDSKLTIIRDKFDAHFPNLLRLQKLDIRHLSPTESASSKL